MSPQPLLLSLALPGHSQQGPGGVNHRSRDGARLGASVSTVTQEQTRGGGMVAGRAAEAQLSQLRTRLLPLPRSRCVRSTWVLPPLEAVWLRVCVLVPLRVLVPVSLVTPVCGCTSPGQ